MILSAMSLFFALLGSQSHPYIKVCIRLLLCLIIASVLYDLNLHGQDWINYNTIFTSNDDELYYYYEPLFSLFMHLLLFISSGSYDLAVFIFYLIVLIYLCYIFEFFDMAVEYWLFVVIFSLGSTLFTDQLRQLMATCFVVTAFLFFIKNNCVFSKTVIFFIIIATLSHYSAIFSLLVFTFSRVDEKSKLIFLSSVLISVSLMFQSSSLLSYINLLPFNTYKIEYYLSISSGYNWGPLTLLSFFYVIYFICFSRCNVYHNIYFCAAVMQLSVVSIFPGLFRFIVYNIVIGSVACAYYFSSKKIFEKLITIKLFNSLIVWMYLIVVFTSYYYAQNGGDNQIDFWYIPFVE